VFNIKSLGLCSGVVELSVHLGGVAAYVGDWRPKIRGTGVTRWCSWLRHYATSRKVLGSVSDGVIGIFHWHNPAGRTVALGSIQFLTEISWG
jgi:hypothetical protein